MGTSNLTVMVYSDVVESSVLGSGKFPLLREVQLLRTGDCESSVEPYITNGLKSEGINWKSLKWRLPHSTDPWPSYRLGKAW